MKTISTLALTLGVALAGVGTPAEAQKRGKAAAPVAVPGERVYNLSKGARPAISALQTAVKANDAATYSTSLAAAQAVATTPDDRYVVAQLQLQQAIASGSKPAQAVALEALLASGGAQPTETAPIYRNIASLAMEAKDYNKAGAAYERVIALQPNDPENLVQLAELRNRQKRIPEGVELLERAIAAKQAAGQPADESWYKAAVGRSADAKLAPQSLKLTRDWLTAYPTANNWRDALSNYRFLVPLDEKAELDRFRLMRAAGALQGERAYKQFADFLTFRRLHGEAKAVLDEGVSKRIIDPTKPEYRAAIAAANAKAATDRPTIVQSEAKAQSSATGNVALNVADSYFGYGDYAKAATFYRTALSKTGEDPNLINTRLGIALAMQGDRAGATAAFNAVTGPRQDLARFWTLWLSKRA